jgi:enoyl-CoA hydratase/carnithine racemase
MMSSDAVVIDAPEYETTADWLADPSSGAALCKNEIWREIYELCTFPKPTISIIHPGTAAAEGPALLASIVVAKKGTVITAGVPASPQGPAVPIIPGTSYKLSRLFGGPAMGLYLAMTGHALQASDALHAGLVTHALDESFTQRNLMENIASSAYGQYDNFVEQLDLMAMTTMASASLLHAPEPGQKGLLELVQATFGSANTVAALKKLLKNDGSKWSAACLDSMASYPDWHTELTFQLLKAAAKLPLEGCLQLEHVAAKNIWARRSAGGEFTTSATMALLDPPMDGAYQPLSLSRREQLFPFSDADIWHLHETRAALEGRLTEDPSDTVRAFPGRLSALSVFHSNSNWYDAFCMGAEGA